MSHYDDFPLDNSHVVSDLPFTTPDLRVGEGGSVRPATNSLVGLTSLV